MGFECQIESSDVCVSNHPDGFVVAANVLGNSHERVTTVPALVALDVGQDVDWCTTDGTVSIGCG